MLYAMPAGPYSVDAAAVKLLKSIYWGPEGHRTPSVPDPKVNAVLTAAGLWTDRVHGEVGHDDLVAMTRQVADETSLPAVGAAFIGSLRSRRLDLRSALGSFAYARHLPPHTFSPFPGSGGLCQVCGTAESAELEDPNLLNFERFQWGGVRRSALEYCCFDLLQFSRAPGVAVTAEDIELLDRAVDVIRALPPRTTAGRAAGALTMFPGNRDERTGFLEILAVCGILQTSRCPGFASAFVPYGRRPQPDGTNDLPYPLWCWTAAAGVDDENLTTFLRPA